MAKKKKKKKPMDGLEALKAALGPSGAKDDDKAGEEPQAEPEGPDDEGAEETGGDPPSYDDAPDFDPSPPEDDVPVMDETREEPPPAQEEEVPVLGADREDPAPEADEKKEEPQVSEDRFQAGRSTEMADDVSTGGGELDPIQTSLEGIFSDQASAADSASGKVLDNLGQAGSILESQYRKIIDLLRANEVLVRDAGRLGDSVKKRRDLKASIEDAIAELTAANEQLQNSQQRLEGEKEGLNSEKERATSENDELNANIRELTEEIQSLSTENEDLTAETVKLEKERDHLEDDVRRLTRLKEEYLANVARFREEGKE